MDMQLPEAFAHGAVDNEVEAGIECDEKRGHAGHDEHPAGEAETGVSDLRDDEHLVEVEHEAGDGGDEEDDDHSEEHELLIGTLLLTITYSRMTFARAVGSLLPCLCLSANPTESAQV